MILCRVRWELLLSLTTTAPLKKAQNQNETMSSNSLEILGYMVVLLALLPFVAYALGTADILWTRLESGNIKFVMHGETLHRIIHDVRGFKLDDHNKFIPDTSKRKRHWLGLYWVGIPPFASIHTFQITKERENPRGASPKEWITVDKHAATVNSLRFTFPRPYMLSKVELGDRVPVDLLVVVKLEVVDPFMPVFNFKGAFFDNAGSLIRAAVSDAVKGTTGHPIGIDEFVNLPKGEADGILRPLKEDSTRLNDDLIRQVGLKVVGISIPQYDPSDESLRNAMNAKTIAEHNAEARRIAAEGEAQATERLARARGQQIKTTVDALALKGASPDVVARGAAAVLEMEAAAGKDSKITTLVQGGDAKPVIPVGGKTP